MSNIKYEDVLKILRGVAETNIVDDISLAIRTNGKSKSVEDFNILDEYQKRFNENPSVLKITYNDNNLFVYKKLEEILTEKFPNSKILFSEREFNIKRNDYSTSREVWYIDEGYLLNIWTTESRHLYANPEYDIKMNDHEQLIELNSLLIPPPNSNKINRETENAIINAFKTVTIQEYERNTIGMMSVEGTGELYVKEFSLDKKFKIKDLDLHYGDDFKSFHNLLFKKLKSDKKGLVLLHGESGSGKCVDGSTMVTIRNKTTGEIINISIEDFNKLL